MTPDAEAILRARAASYARRGQLDRPDADTTAVVVIRVRTGLLALPLDRVDAVRSLPFTAGPPHGALLGIVVHHGAVVSVVDVAILLGETASEVGEQALVAVVSTPAGPLALLALDVVGTREVGDAERQHVAIESGSVALWTTADGALFIDPDRLADWPGVSLQPRRV